MGGARVILCTAPNSKAIFRTRWRPRRNGEAIIVTGAREPIQIAPMQLLGADVSQGLGKRGYRGGHQFQRAVQCQTHG